MFDSDLLEYALYKSASNTTLASIQRDYESNRDLIEWVENKVGTTQVSKFAYINDTLGRRRNVIRTGQAVDSAPPYGDTGFTEDFGYNKRSELETTDRFLWADGKGDRLTTYGEYDYAYDNIGNRLRHHLDDPDLDDPTTYDADDLNRYAWLQPPDSAPREYLCYDDDGNLLREGKTTSDCPGTDGLREFKWDAENRLVEVIPLSPAPNDKKVKFVYDYMGRRVRKDVFYYAGGWPAEDDPDERWHFVYDGWNVVMMLDGMDGPDPGTEPDNTTMRKYTWGLDLSGTIHGAGGIGGLLAAVETQGTTSEDDDDRYWFLYDANGNVGQVLDATDTNNISIAATYEYDPYGNVISSTGAYKDVNPFKFSTKWFDPETGLGYWGIRYYLPKLGRWGSEDPIGERGSSNLYEYVRNRPTDVTDSLGNCPAINPDDVAWTSVVLEVGDSYFDWEPSRYLSAGIAVHGAIDRARLSNPCCPAIGVVQITTENYDNGGYGSWTVDDEDSPPVIPFYAHSSPNPPAAQTSFDFTDEPGWNPALAANDSEFTMLFETCLVCAVQSNGKWGVGCPLALIPTDPFKLNTGHPLHACLPGAGLSVC